MTTTTDLSPEQLEYLHKALAYYDYLDYFGHANLCSLVAMARAKQAAEEETAMFKKLVTEKMQPFLDLGVSAGIDRALKLVNEKHDAIERAEAAERERDAYVALADTKAAEVAALEAERDILREMADALMSVWLDVRAAVNGKPLAEIQAALAQPTDAGGA